MGTHTEEPWTVRHGEAVTVRSPDGGMICLLHWLKGSDGLGGRRTEAEVVANANMIAAAGPMLAALKCARAVIDPERSPETHALVCAAIAKAEAHQPDMGTT